MKKSATRRFKQLMVLIVALLVIALIAPFLIPVGSYKAEIISRVKDATGRDLTIGGPMRLTILPSIGVHIEQAALSNPKGYSTLAMMEVQSASVHVALLPLLTGHVEVKRVVLEKPVVNLEVNAQGVPNWRFTPNDQVPEAPVRHSDSLQIISPAEAEENKSEAAGLLAVLQKMQLGDVEVRGGTLHYTNTPAKKSYALEKISLRLAMKGPEVPFTLAGDAMINGQNTRIDMELTTPQTMVSGGNATLRLSLASEPVRLALNAQIAGFAAQGDTAVSIPSLPALASWASDSLMEWHGQKPLALDIKGKLSCTQAQCMVDNIAMHLDDNALTGKLGLAWQGVPRPAFTAVLQSASLNLTPYLVSQSGHPQNTMLSMLISDARAAAPAASGWSDVPINLSALHALDADIQLAAGEIEGKKFKSGKTNLSMVLKDSVLTLGVPSAALYGGQAKADLTLDGRGTKPLLAVHAEMQGVQAEPLLRAVAQSDYLAGTAEFTLNASGSGASQKEIISNLNGDGKLSVTDGFIRGINMDQLGQGIQAMLSSGNVGVGHGQQTKFSKLAGTYTIAEGIIHNSDLALTSASLAMKGSGSVDLPKRYVNYRLEPALQGKGKNGKQQGGLTVPVIVEGPFEQITFRPDVNALKDALKNPEQVKKTIGSVKDQLKNNKQGIKDIFKNLGR